MNYKNVISKRLKEVVSDRNQTVKAVCEDINFSAKSFGTYINGSSLPKFDFFTAMYNAGYDINWLVGGEGQMYRKAQPTAVPTHIREVEANYSRSPQQALIENHNKANIQAFIDHFFKTADNDEQAWMKIQMQRCFPEFKTFTQSAETEFASQRKQGGE